MYHCPSCGSAEIHYSRPRSSWERLRKRVTDRCVFRCHACAWRGFGEDTGPKFDREEVELATRAVMDPVEPEAYEWPESLQRQPGRSPRRNQPAVAEASNRSRRLSA